VLWRLSSFLSLISEVVRQIGTSECQKRFCGSRRWRFIPPEWIKNVCRIDRRSKCASRIWTLKTAEKTLEETLMSSVINVKRAHKLNGAIDRLSSLFLLLEFTFNFLHKLYHLLSMLGKYLLRLVVLLFPHVLMFTSHARSLFSHHAPGIPISNLTLSSAHIKARRAAVSSASPSSSHPSSPRSIFPSKGFNCQVLVTGWGSGAERQAGRNINKIKKHSLMRHNSLQKNKVQKGQAEDRQSGQAGSTGRIRYDRQDDGKRTRN